MKHPKKKKKICFDEIELKYKNKKGVSWTYRCISVGRRNTEKQMIDLDEKVQDLIFFKKKGV